MNPNLPTLLPTETTIAGLFDTEFQFSIPSYQRAYSWGKKQHGQFLDDLKDQPPGKPYFLGHFLFELDETGANSRQLLLIDGQQRLTTVVIFISCLCRELARRAGSGAVAEGIAGLTEKLRNRYLQTPDGNRLRTVPYDNAFFTRLIIEDQGSPMMPETRSQQQIAEARKFFFTALQAESSVESLVGWLEIVESAVITTFEVPGKVQATQIFAFQNDRGIDLTNLEKLKAFLMHKVYLHSANQAEKEAVGEIEQHFSDIYKFTEKLRHLTEDQVLAHHCTAYLKGSDEGAFGNIKSTFKAQAKVAAVRWIKEFCRTLRETYLHATEIEKAAEHDCDFADVLILDPEHSWPVLLKLYRFHKGEIRQPEYRRVLRLMELTLFKKEYTTGEYRSHSFPWLARTYQGNVAEITTVLEYWSQRGFKDYWPFNQQYQACLNGNYHYFPATRYLLWKYENHLRNQHRNREMSPVEYLNLYEGTTLNSTIDHIMPQNPHGPRHTQEFNERFLNNLGNLVLMNHGKNSSANNSLPADKVTTLRNSTLISHHRVAEMIERSGKWGEEEIAARKQQIIEFSLDRWKIK